MTVYSPLASVSATREVLERHGLATKKALGQHFLVNDQVVGKIVSLAETCGDDVVLEVGPGIGTLTCALLQSAGAVVAIERDAALPEVLGETCAPWGERFALIEGDALDVAPGIIEEALDSIPPITDAGLALRLLPNKFVANLPYAVAATLVLDFFERFPSLESATVMVQKEVAARMAAKPGTKDYGAYTVKLSLLAESRGSFDVAPGNFFPPPHVDSTVIRLDRVELRDEEGKAIDEATRKLAATLADAAFAQRRKTLSNSMRSFFSSRRAVTLGMSCEVDGAELAEKLPSLFEAAAIDSRRRGETLVREDYLRMAKHLQELLP